MHVLLNYQGSFAILLFLFNAVRPSLRPTKIKYSTNIKITRKTNCLEQKHMLSTLVESYSKHISLFPTIVPDLYNCQRSNLCHETDHYSEDHVLSPA